MKKSHTRYNNSLTSMKSLANLWAILLPALGFLLASVPLKADAIGPLSFSRRQYRSVRKSVSQMSRAAVRRSSKDPCRADDRLKEFQNHLTELKGRTRRWPRSYRRKLKKMFWQYQKWAKRKRRKTSPKCRRIRLFDETSTDIKRGYIRAIEGWNERPCRAWNRLIRYNAQISRLRKRTFRRLSRRKQRIIQKLKRRYLSLAKRRKRKLWPHCSNLWEQTYKARSRKFRRSCSRAFGTRRKRSQSLLWIGINTRAKVYLNGKFCGLSPLSGRLKAGRYKIKLLHPTSQETLQRSIRLYRGLPHVFIHTMKVATAVASSPQLPRTGIEAPGNRKPIRRTKALQLDLSGSRDNPPARNDRSHAGNAHSGNGKVASSGNQDFDAPDSSVKKSVRRPGSAPFFASAGVRMFSRTFYYNDDLFGTLQPYNLPMAPAAIVGLEWYPGGHVSQGPLSYIGLLANFQYALGLQSKSPDGTLYQTTSMSFDVGLIGKIPLGRVSLQPRASFGLHSFDLGLPADGKVNLPATSYQMLILGGGARWDITEQFALRLLADYRLIFGTGQIGTEAFFPRASAGGLDAELALLVQITRNVGIQAGFQYLHYFFSMNSKPGDKQVAGGAIDQYMQFDLRLTLAF